MGIEVLGSGCKNCNALEAATTTPALDRLEIDQEVTKVTDYGRIAAYGVMSTPPSPSTATSRPQGASRASTKSPT